ncbi:LOW QUALITY PROTEIN: uncharacterized protein Dyak_GE27307 [Drosophila yakuba]|uniref:Uncharacterized protein n=1 Tax=Drosophila yakuba TaxID=7245 RepID=A0A0R1DU74_DROYA|nr:LOW QUALITY PROTEIN: uncharacterized protein Dyak_GE27307 [Drosophila yakuba]
MLTKKFGAAVDVFAGIFPMPFSLFKTVSIAGRLPKFKSFSAITLNRRDSNDTQMEFGAAETTTTGWKTRNGHH